MMPFPIPGSHKKLKKQHIARSIKLQSYHTYIFMDIPLPSDVLQYLFTLASFQLVDIINLSMVSQQLRRISLSEENWYTISDAVGILTRFMRRIYQSNISYPVDKIQQMYQTDIIDWGSVPVLLEITFNNQTGFDTFYQHFPNYQYLYANERISIESFGKKSFKNIHMTTHDLGSVYFDHRRFCDILTHRDMHCYVNAITEIIATEHMLDCEFLAKYCPQIEKLVIRDLYHVEQLKHVKLKYLCVTYPQPYEWIKTLPDTIESLIMLCPVKMNKPFYQLDALQYRNDLRLNKFPHLKYLRMELTE
jgi:hypothetical protein